MAKVAVSLARDNLLPLLGDEAKLLQDIPKDFVDIKKELEYFQAFLKDVDKRVVDEKANANKGIKTWVKEFRETSFCIEDVIDEYKIYVEQQLDALGFAALLFKCDITHFIETLKCCHQLASEIQQIKSVFDELKQRRKDYNFLNQPSSEQGQSINISSQSVKWIDPRTVCPHLDGAQVVGFEDPIDELICCLVEGPIERIVIFVAGMGSLGKTTLAGNVFYNQKLELITHRNTWQTKFT